ncbi:MAG: CRISPR-associated endonuclease Cas1 [Deltaproteobacteria bacterium]|nr:CRISPR-associated endonuclease Cas1 [Deltaproteobacteria bacterium]
MATDDIPPIPVRMLNEFVYCHRLGYQMWVQGEFAHSADTIDGGIKHRHVDKGGGETLPVAPEEETEIHARSVSLSSDRLGITAKMDLVEGQGAMVRPVDYKRGKRPHVAGGVYEPERVQLCAQGLLLREHGYVCEGGEIYFVASRERVPVAFDNELVATTLHAITDFRTLARSGQIPPPLEESVKCPRCSLAGICLPDEVRFLGQAGAEPRPIMAAVDSALPLYIQSSRAYVRKKGERISIEEERQEVASAAFGDVSQLVLFGSGSLTTPTLHECLRRQIPVTWLSYGGWFLGHTVSTGHRNVEVRTRQYRASFDENSCLHLARRLTAGKIANCRTLLKRNWKGADADVKPVLQALRRGAAAALRARALDQLLGIEGTAANSYFSAFSGMLSRAEGEPLAFDLTGRNRRPPLDPVNALLSFAYAMLVREWTVALSAVGLDPYRGYYHQPRFGRPALALDMMEPFRPLVADSTVLMVINNGEIRTEDFVHAAGACNLKDRARKGFIAAFERRLNQEVTHPIFRYKVSYRRLLEVQSRLLIRYLNDEIPQYPVFMTR